MFMEYFCLENYAGIYAGTLLDKIEIDFTQCKHRKIVIRGDGGSGKSTLLRCFSLFPDINKEIRSGYDGCKIGIFVTHTTRYKFRIEYEWNKKTKSRATTKCFIEKYTLDGPVELNPGGTVRSYFDVLETELGIDPNFISLSFLSTEDKGIVGKTPTERKKMVSYALDDIEVYNNINKKISKKSNTVKAMLNNVANKINNIGSEETINNRLKVLEQQILYNSKQRDSLISNRGKIEAEIAQLDPDGSVQSMKKELIDRIASVQQERNKLRNGLNFFATHEKHGLVDNELTDMGLAMEKLLSINISKTGFINKRDELKSKLQNLLVSQEEESRSIELKTQRLMTLQNECIYDNIEEQIEKYKSMIAEYEKVFDSIHIEDALSITKDEYVTGLNVSRDIKDMIDAFRSFVYPFTLEESVNAVRFNTDKMKEYNALLVKRDTINTNLLGLNKDYNYNMGLLDKMSALSIRPENCKIDTCPFINEALEAAKKKPQDQLDRLAEQIQANQDDLSKTEQRIKELEEVLSCVANLKIILRNIDNNRGILSKLPIKDLFLDRETLFKKIINMSSFDEINQIYDSISIAGMFEEYKIAKDNLYKLEADYKIYESRNIIIEELSNDIDQLNDRLKDVVSEIKDINATIAGLDNTIQDKENLYDTTDKFIKMIKQFQSVDTELEEMKSRLSMVTSNMSKLDNTLERKLNIELDLQKIGEILEPLMSEREKLNYQIDLLHEYKKEYEELSDKYIKLEIIKKYSSPSKEGIQNRFIEVYMNSTRTMANDILRLFFGGRLELYPYDLRDGFRIPCYSYFSNMLQNDVSDCSRSEKAMATLAISISLMKQASENCSYNILKLDEIDEGLDTQNSNAFMPAMEKIFEMLDIQQCLMVTHSDQVDLSDCDIIQLRRINSNDDDMSQGNYIFTL